MGRGGSKGADRRDGNETRAALGFRWHIRTPSPSTAECPTHAGATGGTECRGHCGALRPVGARSDRSRSMSCPRTVRAGRWAEAAVRSRRRWQPMKGPAAGPHPRRALRCNARPLRPLSHRDFKSAFVPKSRRLRQLVPPAARWPLKTGVWKPAPNPPSPQIGAISGPGPPPARSAAPSRPSRPSPASSGAMNPLRRPSEPGGAVLDATLPLPRERRTAQISGAHHQVDAWNHTPPRRRR